MSEVITIILQPEIQSALEDMTQKEGLSSNVIINEALKEYLFFSQLRTLREQMIASAQTKGIRTAEDVFDRVS